MSNQEGGEGLCSGDARATEVMLHVCAVSVCALCRRGEGWLCRGDGMHEPQCLKGGEVGLGGPGFATLQRSCHIVASSRLCCAQCVCRGGGVGVA